MSGDYRRDFTAPNNADWVESFVLGDPDDDSWTLTGATILMEMRPNPGHPDELISIGVGTGITVDNAATRQVSILVAAETMAGIVPKDYPYDIVVTISGVRRLRQKGTVTVAAGVSEPA